ncbi:hypothetical protein ASAC_0503 [Acidilobus saccharovorans 345-15]|uniref:DUF2250 domain-containing protein n=1 Tax=Acidilobus saccharovorans (strain DSM 16705 / JCM 18335 / VKM B-2471 / 345-15) TaxID=666510 RepID=D9Q0S2_ACIS3|nr:hypothetical protein [Acidilobus saccharovorans]ADL18910.1 hypothetical protein ASAC_0503 [Acidilobus saccharovorans 345-15]
MKEGSDEDNEAPLTELEKLILAHIYKYGPDSPWYMARRLMGASGWAPKYSEDEIEQACNDLEAKGYLTRFKGQLKREVTSSVKPWLKFKSREMGHKPNGVYYDLTKAGRKLASTIYKAMRQEGTHDI